MLKKEVKFDWNNDCTQAYHKLKAILTSYPILRSPNFSKPFELSVDASDVGVGAMLVQPDDNRIKHPGAYHSKKLNSAQQKYSTIEKETLGLIMTLEHFEVYLSCTPNPIKILTDHNPLLFLQRYKNKNRRLMRWSLILQEWDIDINHIPGRENKIPDILSRV